ncbi:MAG TPA: SDR family NAD(P)-dependent oxidoreductase [Methanocorpusculum sp.]|nr:SDR family NAD(P)-dependent oxidoreductase [Methanocorpusculum sp.]HJK80770.1 SDR family NAD(P)-dependent oxidoreductase [Methanocorpusculum sp.]
MSDTFKEKICIITGGTSGIGFAVAEELLRRGAVVYVIGSRESSVEKTKPRLAAYPQARFDAVDVADADAVKRLIDRVVAETGRIDYLFNNAGIAMTYPTELIPYEQWKSLIDTNILGVVNGVYHTLPLMLKQGFGSIINTSSIGGLTWPAYQTGYVLTKSAVLSMTWCMRYEYANRNIRFQAVCPANVATEIFKGSTPPPGAMPVQEAAVEILNGVENNDAIIILPKDLKDIITRLKTEPAFEDWLYTETARLRYESVQKGLPPVDVPDFSAYPGDTV